MGYTVGSFLSQRWTFTRKGNAKLPSDINLTAPTICLEMLYLPWVPLIQIITTFCKKGTWDYSLIINIWAINMLDFTLIMPWQFPILHDEVQIHIFGYLGFPSQSRHMYFGDRWVSYSKLTSDMDVTLTPHFPLRNPCLSLNVLSYDVLLTCLDLRYCRVQGWDPFLHIKKIYLLQLHKSQESLMSEDGCNAVSSRLWAWHASAAPSVLKTWI